VYIAIQKDLEDQRKEAVMGYEKFTKLRRPSKDQPMITVLKGGQLSANRACVEKYLKKFKYVEMYYDTEQGKIGIRPTKEPSKDACNIRFIKNGTLAIISVVEFLKRFEIKHTESAAYPATWNDKEKLIEIALK